MVGQLRHVVPPAKTQQESLRAEFNRLLADRCVPEEDISDAWRLAFLAGATLETEMAEKGRLLVERARAGAEISNRRRIAQASATREEAISLAARLLECACLPEGEVRWSIPLLASEVRESWKREGAPAARTIEAYLRTGVQAGRLPGFLIAARRKASIASATA